MESDFQSINFDRNFKEIKFLLSAIVKKNSRKHPLKLEEGM